MTDEPVNAAEDESEEKKKPSQATLLVKLARDRFRLVNGDDGRPYAVAKQGASVARPLRGANGLRKYLARLYSESCGGTTPSQSALADALTVLEGYAADEKPEPIYLRVAPYHDGVCLDLGTPDGRCVVVNRHCWVTLPRAPVLFRRTNLTAPMPEPVQGGSLEPLLDLVNADEDRRRVLVGWLVSTLIPTMPHAILAIFGEQGTAKSTATKLLMQLVDPSTAPLRSPPRDVRQWAVTANASWTVALDNVSDVQPWLSDLLCKAVTGDGHVDRALYSDDDVAVLRFRRVLAINGISLGALKGDLADRFLPVELEVITGQKRRPDEEVQEAVAKAHPEALGALLDLLVKVLGELPNVQLDSLPRMADFARVLAAVDTVQGWETLKTYQDAFDGLAETVVASDPFATSLREFADTQQIDKPWEGPATDLLHLIPLPDPKPRDWPKTAQAVAGRLKRCAPALRQLGYIAEHGKQDPVTRRRAWVLGPTEKTVNGKTQDRSGQSTFGSFDPSKPQVSAPKDLDPHPSDLFEAAAEAKDPEGSTPRSFTHPDQQKHPESEGSKDPNVDTHLLSGTPGRCSHCVRDRPVRKTPPGTPLCQDCDELLNHSHPSNRAWLPSCRACGEPIDPVVGDIHPSCEGTA